MKQNTTRISIGIIIFISIIAGTISLGGRPLMFVHIPSILIVILVGGSLGLASYRGGGVIGYIKACKKHFISAGILGTVIGVTQMLANLSTPETLGQGAAIALLTVFYGIILYCIADAITA